jgi:Rod binding domain-containing protein
MDAALQSIQSAGDIAVSQAGQQAVLGQLGARRPSTADINKSAQDFEAMFATEMLQPMFEGVSVDPMFGGGHGEEVMRSFMLQEYGKIIAKSGALGIANSVKSEMLRAQETTSPQTTRPQPNPQTGAAYAAP